jgi:hypothetical protein
MQPAQPNVKKTKFDNHKIQEMRTSEAVFITQEKVRLIMAGKNKKVRVSFYNRKSGEILSYFSIKLLPLHIIITALIP